MGWTSCPEPLNLTCSLFLRGTFKRQIPRTVISSILQTSEMRHLHTAVILKLYYLHWNSENHQEWVPCKRNYQGLRALGSAIHDKRMLKAPQNLTWALITQILGGAAKRIFSNKPTADGPRMVSQADSRNARTRSRSHQKAGSRAEYLQLLTTHTSTFCLGLKGLQTISLEARHSKDPVKG